MTLQFRGSRHPASGLNSWLHTGHRSMCCVQPDTRRRAPSAPVAPAAPAAPVRVIGTPRAT
eukprot:1676804-Prymnesium_polylepis.1